MSLTIKSIVEEFGISEEEAEHFLFGGSCEEQEDEYCLSLARAYLRSNKDDRGLARVIREARDAVRDPLVSQLLYYKDKEYNGT